MTGRGGGATATDRVPEPWRRVAAFAASAYVVSTAVGVVMRGVFVGLDPGIPFDHLLHAHSHTLYFGWVGLLVLALAGAILARPSRSLRGVAGILVATTPAILVAFLAAGYHPVSIAVSTLVMFAWYAAIATWWWSARRLVGLGVSAIRAAFAYLGVASLGVWLLAWMQASGGRSALAESLAIHAFLLGFGWFAVLGTVGLVVLHAPRLGLDLPGTGVRRALRWWVGLAWLSFPLGVVGGPEVPWLGPAARLAGLALLYPGLLWVRALWRAAPPGRAGRLWRVVACWFAVGVLTTAAVAVAGSAALLAGGRQGVIVHLHAVFVGFVTGALVLVAAGPVRGLGLHHWSLAVMLLGLGTVPLGAGTAGMWVAAAASVVLWAAGARWASAIVRGTAPPVPAATGGTASAGRELSSARGSS